MSDSDNGVLTVEEDRTGENLLVRSLREENYGTLIKANVDSSGVIREEGTGKSFSSDCYEVVVYE